MPKKSIFIISLVLSAFFCAEVFSDECKELFKNNKHLSNPTQKKNVKNYRKINKKLLKAAKKGNLQKLEEALDEGANINARRKDGQTALTLSIEHKRKKVFFKLIDRNVDVNQAGRNGIPPLSWAASVGDIDMANTLVEKDADVHAVDKHGSNALIWAFDKEMSEFLVKSGVRKVKNKYKETALMWAKDEAQAQFLIDEGVKINAKDILGNSALSWSIDNIVQDVSEVLLINKAKFSIKDKDGGDLLIQASASGNLHGVRFLKERGFDLNKKNKMAGETGLMLASGFGHLEVVKFFVKNDVDINDTDNEGDTAGHWALKESQIEILFFLIENELDIDIQNNQGDTLLHLAAMLGYPEVVDRLVELGAKLDVVNSFGDTPRSAAEFVGHKEIADFLKSKSTKPVEPVSPDQNFVWGIKKLLTFEK